ASFGFVVTPCVNKRAANCGGPSTREENAPPERTVRGHSKSVKTHKLLPSKFRRDFVIFGGLRVVTPDRSALLPNRRLLGACNEESVGGLLGGGARGGEPSISICSYALLVHTSSCFKCQRPP